MNVSHQMPITKWTLCGEQMNGTQRRGTGKSMRNTLYVQQYGKRHLSGWNGVEQQKIKPITLAIVELRLSEGISQLVSQSVSRKFCWVDLKALPHHHLRKLWMIFRWIYFVGHPHIFLVSTIVVHDTYFASAHRKEWFHCMI